MTAASDIRAEHALARPLTVADIKAFVADGVQVEALSRTQFGDLALIGRERVLFDGGKFEFARYARHGGAASNAFTFVIQDSFGEAVDIAAFRPDRVATWLGADLIGGEQAFMPRVGDDALDVHETVLDWLQAGRRGVVILNPQRAASDLRLVGPLRVRSVEHGRQLRAALTTEAPRIVVGNVHDKVRVADRSAA